MLRELFYFVILSAACWAIGSSISLRSISPVLDKAIQNRVVVAGEVSQSSDVSDLDRQGDDFPLPPTESNPAQAVGGQDRNRQENFSKPKNDPQMSVGNPSINITSILTSPLFLAISVCFVASVGPIVFNHTDWAIRNPGVGPLLTIFWRMSWILIAVVVSAATKWHDNKTFLLSMVGCYFPFLLLESTLSIRRTSRFDRLRGEESRASSHQSELPIERMHV